MGGYLFSRAQIWLSAQSLLKLEVFDIPLGVCPWSISAALKVFLAPLEVLGFRYLRLPAFVPVDNPLRQISFG